MLSDKASKSACVNWEYVYISKEGQYISTQN